MPAPPLYFLEIRQAQIQVQSAQKRVKLYRDTLLPQAEAAFKATTAAYQNDRGEFMNLIDSQNLLLDIRTRLLQGARGGRRRQRATGARDRCARASRNQPNFHAGEDRTK